MNELDHVNHFANHFVMQGDYYGMLNHPSHEESFEENVDFEEEEYPEEYVLEDVESLFSEVEESDDPRSAEDEKDEKDEREEEEIQIMNTEKKSSVLRNLTKLIVMWMFL